MGAEARLVIAAVEASTMQISCAVGPVERSAGGGAVEALGTLMEEAVAAAGASLSALEAIVVGAGPGSFTGIRSAVTFANALSYALGCPVGAVSTLDSVAVAVSVPGQRAMVALEAGRGRLYVAGYAGDLAREAGPLHVEGDEFVRLVASEKPDRLYGAGAMRLEASLAAPVSREAGVHPTARGHLRLAAERPDWVRWSDAAGALPDYGVAPPVQN
jgi:tRNA threonylcarbamoyl adenosine modification protein YeaZ